MLMIFFVRNNEWWTPAIWNYLGHFDIGMEDCPVINKRYIYTYNIYIYMIYLLKYAKRWFSTFFHYHWLVLQPIGVLGIPGRWWWPGILALTMEWPPCSFYQSVLFLVVQSTFLRLNDVKCVHGLFVKKIILGYQIIISLVSFMGAIEISQKISSNWP